MPLVDGLQNETFRDTVRNVIADFVPDGWRGLGAVAPSDQGELLANWRETLRANGLLGVGWPATYGGGGRTLADESVFHEECVRAGLPSLPHPNDGFGFQLLGPTLLQCGTEEQKSYFLPRTISGEIRWAQGYSEPEAGSDLFALRTTATLDRDEWVINGQKIWQTAGLTANWIFALVRTDPAASRSAGISFLLIPVDQAGVEVRGIKNMAGETEFAEVFFDNARTASHQVVGGVNNGAKVALTLLGYERGAGGLAIALTLEIELNRVIEVARAYGRHTDGDIRQRIARCREIVHVLHCSGIQSLAMLQQHGHLGPESSFTKLLTAEYRQTVTELALDILGADALTPCGAPPISSLEPQPLGLDPTSSAAWVADYLNARPGTIYGGSSEIQRNTIAEQVLGLPREPRPAR
jgi:alkylation response protein AidB-like acyl-CoA dehydrogenase